MLVQNGFGRVLVKVQLPLKPTDILIDLWIMLIKENLHATFPYTLWRFIDGKSLHIALVDGGITNSSQLMFHEKRLMKASIIVHTCQVISPLLLTGLWSK